MRNFALRTKSALECASQPTRPSRSIGFGAVYQSNHAGAFAMAACGCEAVASNLRKRTDLTAVWPPGSRGAPPGLTPEGANHQEAPEAAGNQPAASVFSGALFWSVAPRPIDHLFVDVSLIPM